MSELNVDRLTEVLPELDELRPMLDHVLATSLPDPRRAWSSSGELGTVGDRLVEPDAVEDAVDDLAERLRNRISTVYRALVRVIRALEEDDPAAAARALVEIAELEEAGDRPDRAEAYALAARELARGLEDRRPLGLALRRAARAARALGELERSLEWYGSAHEIGRAAGDSRGAAEAAVGAGNVREQQGRWKEAEAWYRKALEALEEVDEPVPERWHAALNLHIALRSRGDLEPSVAWLRKAERWAEEAGDAAALPYLENARGQYRMALGEFEEAELCLRRALAEAEDARARVTILLNLGETLLAMERTLEAGEAAREAELEALRAGVGGRLPEVYRLLGRVAAENDEPDAFVLFERAVRIVRERSLPPFEEAVTLQAYADVERRLGERDSAQRLQERAREIYDELGIQNSRQRWADFFGPETDEADSPGGGHDHA